MCLVRVDPTSTNKMAQTAAVRIAQHPIFGKVLEAGPEGFAVGQTVIKEMPLVHYPADQKVSSPILRCCPLPQGSASILQRAQAFADAAPEARAHVLREFHTPAEFPGEPRLAVKVGNKAL